MEESKGMFKGGILIKIFNRLGNMINSNGNATMKPPMNAMANGWCICAPGPMPNARGKSAAMAPEAFIKFGRNQAETATTSALLPPTFTSDKNL